MDKGDDEILAMTIEWIQNSTIIDFKARIFTGELLIKFIELTQENVRDELCQRLKSVIAYFRLFDTVSFFIVSFHIGIRIVFLYLLFFNEVQFYYKYHSFRNGISNLQNLLRSV